MNYALNKNSKIKHAIKSLDPDDQQMLSKTFHEVGLKSLWSMFYIEFNKIMLLLILL